MLTLTHLPMRGMIVRFKLCCCFHFINKNHVFSCETIYWFILSGVGQRLYYGAHYIIIYSYKVWRRNMILIIFQSLFNVMSPLQVAYFKPKKKRLFLWISDSQDTLLLTLLFNRKKCGNSGSVVHCSVVVVVSKIHC